MSKITKKQMDKFFNNHPLDILQKIIFLEKFNKDDYILLFIIIICIIILLIL